MREVGWPWTVPDGGRGGSTTRADGKVRSMRGKASVCSGPRVGQCCGGFLPKHQHSNTQGKGWEDTRCIFLSETSFHSVIHILVSPLSRKSTKTQGRPSRAPHTLKGRCLPLRPPSQPQQPASRPRKPFPARVCWTG